MIKSTIFSLLLSISLFAANNNDSDNWPNWRGPSHTGEAAGKPPLTWSETENIRWKKEIPGLGLATPVIWGDSVFLLTAVETEKAAEKKLEVDGRRAWMKPILPEKVHKFEVMALSQKDGSVLWRKTAAERTPHETTHGDASWASNSPVTDGEILIAHFGSNGTFAYTLDGKPLWNVDLGDMRTRNGFGEGSSPVIADGLVVINWDHEDASFIVALDKKNGKEVWRRDRDEPTTWSTPLVEEVDGKKQVIVSAANKTRGYDLKTGETIWECGGLTMNVTPSPMVRNNILYVASGYRGSALMAIKLAGAKGDITDTDHVIWKTDRDSPYVPSMLLYEDELYVVKSNNGILSCLDAKTGKVHYGPVRLEGVKGIYASPVGADDKVYITGRNGVSLVIEKGPEFKVLATNTLDDRFDASAAIAGDAIYLRGRKTLYCIGK